MFRGVAVVLLVLAAGACTGHKSANGTIGRGLFTQTQVRHVPGFSTALVTSLPHNAVVQDPDPRGPCGAKVPVVSLADAAGVSVTAQNIRGGAEFVARPPAGAAKRYLDARVGDATAGCAEFETVTNQGVRQRVLLVRIVPLGNDLQQALAVVTAIKIGDSVRAATQVDVRRGDVLAKTVIFTDEPMGDVTVRALASLMGRDLAVFGR